MNPERVFRLYPTFENAVLFLKHKRIHIPFESILRNQSHINNQNDETNLLNIQ